MKMVRTLRFFLDHLNGQNPITAAAAAAAAAKLLQSEFDCPNPSTSVLKIGGTLPSVFRVRDKCDYRKTARERQHCWL